jgi:hypothetical protein
MTSGEFIDGIAKELVLDVYDTESAGKMIAAKAQFGNGDHISVFMETRIDGFYLVDRGSTVHYLYDRHGEDPDKTLIQQILNLFDMKLEGDEITFKVPDQPCTLSFVQFCDAVARVSVLGYM